MKSERTKTLAAIALAVCLMAGCQYPRTYDRWVSVTPGDAQGDVTLYRDVHFDDIPVPAEYVILSKESYSFQGTTSRTAVFHYQGPLEWTEALKFYRTEMPAAGWTRLETERGFDFRVFHFTKGPEKIILTVRQLSDGSKAELQLDNIERNDLLLKGRLPSMDL